jgi:hypothetical protein
MKGETTVYIGAPVPIHLAARLRAAAAVEDRSVSAVLRRLVTDYLKTRAEV